MSRVLVTGGSGFIGAAVAAALARRGDHVLATDIAETPPVTALAQECPDRFRFESADLSEWAPIASLIKEFKPEAIIHCAAIVGVRNSVAAPFATMRINIEGTLNLMELMRLFEIKRMVHISSEETYGAFETDTITEDHPQRPIKAYGISKFAVEQLARDYVETHGLEIIHARTCWVYGPGLPRPRIPKTLVDAIVDGGSCHVENGADFRTDHIYIDDCVDGILKVLDHPVHKYDAYHISTGEAPSLGEIVDYLKELAPDADISVGPGNYEFTKGLPTLKKGALDISRARKEIGHAPKHDYRSGLAAYIDWRRSNPV